MGGSPNGSLDVAPAEPSFPIAQLVRWGFLAASILLVGGYCASSPPAAEVARWYSAAAEEAMLDREYAQAAQWYATALEWDPDNLEFHFQRANALLDAGEAEQALAALGEIAEPLQDQPAVWTLRARILQRLGRHEEAVAEMDRSVQLAKEALAELKVAGAEADVLQRATDQLALHLNNQAYFQAVGRVDLEDALQKADQALSLTLAERVLPAAGNREVILDTRGYLRLLLGEANGARQDLEAAVLLAERSYRRFLAAEAMLSRNLLDQRAFDLRRRLEEENLAVLYHHRGEAYRKLGRLRDAELDFARAQRLGYDPARGVQ